MKARKDGRFARVVRIDGERFYIYGKTAKEVTDQIEELKKRHQKGLTLRDDTIFWDLAELWYYTKIKNNTRLSVSTKDMYKTVINAHVKIFADEKVREMKPLPLEGYLNSLSVSASLINKIRITFGQIFDVAIENEIISTNPMSRIGAIECDPPKREFYDHDERLHLIKAFENSNKQLHILTMLYTGMRMKEALALMWGDFDEDTQTISISKRLEFINANETTIAVPKTKAGNRNIPINEELTKLLAKARGKKFPNNPIFPRASDGEYHTRTSAGNLVRDIENILFAYCKRNKIPQIKFGYHTLRHTYTTALYDAEIDLKTMQEYLGHAESDVTLDIYTHISNTRKIQQRDKIETLYTQKQAESKVRQIK